MSTVRLTFLYPHLFRSIRLVDGPALQGTRTCRRAVPRAPRRHYAAFTPTTAARKASYARRHGKAVEPQPIESEEAMKPIEMPPPDTDNSSTNADLASSSTSTKTTDGSDPTVDSAAEPLIEGIETASEEEKNKAASEVRDDVRTEAKKSGPLEAMLNVGAEEEARAQQHQQHHHLTPPPYVHHFDSYSLVKQLEGGGYSVAQAITAMKAIRALLAQHLDVAQESLVSKSDVENETYLFRAACSELSTEVKNNRRIADEELRQKRTLLQHEVDILTQSLSQEVSTLNDTTRGMFNDRKIAVREEQKAVDSTIQQIHYKISIDLSSDAKSEIEGLRGVLIRRSVIGIIFMAVMMLGTLRYGTYVSQEHKKEAERADRQAELSKTGDVKRERDHSAAPDAAEILAAN